MATIAASTVARSLRRSGLIHQQQQQWRWFGAMGSKGTKDGGGSEGDEAKKKYGKPEHSIADENFKQRVNKKDEDDETLDKTRFDMSKRSRPSGDE